jgi:hypothetical protein
MNGVKTVEEIMLKHPKTTASNCIITGFLRFFFSEK